MIKKSVNMLSRVYLSLTFFLFFCLPSVLAQIPEELEFSLDANSPVVNLPKIYRTSLDLSGRGKQPDKTLPQTLAAAEALKSWQMDLGFRNIYRLQYNFWEIQQLVKDPDAYQKLLNNYEDIIKKISDSGGTVILNLFGTPDGLGTVLDKNSAPRNLKAYKELVKDAVRKLSCEKKYNIWYEVWNAPDIDDFFIGQRSEYLNLYRIVAEAIKELRQEHKMHIPLGGPSVSAWFRNIEPNNILTPERSLIYELIKYCYSYRLPLDFISWHAYSSDPTEEKYATIYSKPFIELIRDWLTYFKFNSNLPLLVTEWSFDGSANVLSERDKYAHISASYIPARIKNMYEAGLDYQTYFCLEDFADNQVGTIRNLGIFSFDPLRPEHKGYPKVNYNVWRMLGLLGQDLFKSKFSDEFVGIIGTKSSEYLALLIYNYIDPQAAMNYISHKIVDLNSAEQKGILGIVKSDRMKKILAGQINLATLRLSVKTKGILSRAIELNNLANKFAVANRKIKINVKGLKDAYVLSNYVVDNSCSRNCEFKPIQEVEIDFNQGGYFQTMELAPYSVQLLVFKKKPVFAVKPVEKPLETKPVEVKPVETTDGAISIIPVVEEAKPEAKPAEVKPVEEIAEPQVEQKTPLKEINNAEAQ